jgi:hypothetical protein
VAAWIRRSADIAARIATDLSRNKPNAASVVLNPPPGGDGHWPPQREA